MADEAHVNIWEMGTGVWNEWRKSNPTIKPDLSNLDISGEDMHEINYSDTNLRKVVLSRASLNSADLTGADLSGSDLSNANLNEASLRGTTLIETNLERTDFTRADLGNANLSNAYMEQTQFAEAFLGRAVVTGSHILGADFTEAHLTDADFSGCVIGAVFFTKVDLSRCKGLETVIHSHPSTIDFDTVYRSGGNIPEIFLQRAGVSDDLIIQARSHLSTVFPIQFYSCFLSYSHTDKMFAWKLNNSLKSHGVECWLDEHQLLPGDDIYQQVDRGIRLWDKMLLCCSENSLNSWWVDNEIGTAFEKEQRLMKDRGAKVQVLVPLNLDGYLFSEAWKSGYMAQVRRRLAADFTNTDADPKKFEMQMQRLIRALRADDGARGGPPKPKL